MSYPLDPELPATLGALLDKDELVDSEGFTILLISICDDGWPHITMLSVGEVVVAGRIPFGLRSGWVAKPYLTPQGHAILSAVVAGTSYSLRLNALRAGEITTPLAGTLARFNARIDGASGDNAPYAVLEAGVRFRLKDPLQSFARWREVRAALRG